MLNDKVLAAIAAAVNLYLAEEQETAVMEVQKPVPRIPVINLWGMSGRDESMKMRGLWQLGIWKRTPS